eukprot:g23286.t1
MTGECQTSRLLSTGQTTGAEEVLTRRLLHRCMDCDASCIEEVFSLFDGQGHGARWAPHAWRSDDFALPMPQGAASAELYARLRGVVKHNVGRSDCAVWTLPAPGLGLWLWPPMINHALESDGRPNCAHVFVGDVMLFRATAPIRAGEEVLDRYSTPLADHFEFTLHTLAAHGMRDPVYEATAASWQALQEGFHGAPPPQLPAEKKPLAERQSMTDDDHTTLAAIERKVTWSNGVHSVVLPEYEALRDRYKASKSDSLAPPEVRALNLLCVLGFKFEGRAAALEWRSELARRLGLARPMHFAQVKLWAELLERFEHLKGSLSSKEEKLLEEVDSELSKCAAFWTLGRASMETSAGEWKQPARPHVAPAAMAEPKSREERLRDFYASRTSALEAVSWDLAEEATRDAAPELRKKGNDLFEAEDYETRKMGGCQDQMDQE